MFTTHIGKRFIEIYNTKNKTNISAKEFFIEEYFPLFFDDTKLLQSAANTPIFQLVASKKTHIPEARLKARDEIENKVQTYLHSEALLPDMSFAIGYGSADDMGTTSGQIGSMKLPIESEEIYASWIGSALGIGIAGGQNMLLDNEEVLWALYEGWKIYRTLLGQVDGIENKIETWNGVWLEHRFSISYNPRNTSYGNLLKTSKGIVQMERPSWVRILFFLAGRYGGKTSTVYIYQFSQMNTTIGFIQLILPEVKRLPQLYKELFTGKDSDEQKFVTEYETANGFLRVCENGNIGIKQLEPNDLRKYMPGEGKLPTAKDYEKSQITFQTYYTWIIAMINNKEFLELAVNAAKALHTYEQGAERGKTDRTNHVKELINAKTKKECIEALTTIIQKDDSVAEDFNKICDALHLDIPIDTVKYFITLIRFKYCLPEKFLN